MTKPRADTPPSAKLQPRRFARVRLQNDASGTIVIDLKSPSIKCGVVDYSAGGACIQIAPGTMLPKRFELLYAGSKKKCRMVWAKGNRLGVTF